MNVNPASYPSCHHDSTLQFHSYPALAFDEAAANAAPEGQISELALNRIFLKPGEELKVEPGAMLACKDVTVSTEFGHTSMLENIKRYVFGGESVMVNRFTAGEQGGWIALEQARADQMIAIKIFPEDPLLKIKSGAFLASSPNIELEALASGYFNFFRTGSVTVKLTDGQEGRLYINSDHTKIQKIDVNSDDEPVVVEYKSVIAASSTVEYKGVKITDGFVNRVLSGEGNIAQLKGKGVVYLGSTESTGSQTWLSKIVSKIGDNIQLDDPKVLALLGMIIYKFTGFDPTKEDKYSYIVSQPTFDTAKVCLMKNSVQQECLRKYCLQDACGPLIKEMVDTLVKRAGLTLRS